MYWSGGFFVARPRKGLEVTPLLGCDVGVVSLDVGPVSAGLVVIDALDVLPIGIREQEFSGSLVLVVDEVSVTLVAGDFYDYVAGLECIALLGGQARMSSTAREAP